MTYLEFSDCTTNEIGIANEEQTCYVICYTTFDGTHYLIQPFDTTLLTNSVMNDEETLIRNYGDSIIDLNDGKKCIISGYFLCYEELSQAVSAFENLRKKESEWVRYGVVRCKAPIGTKFANGIYERDFPWYDTIKLVAAKELKIDELVWS